MERERRYKILQVDIADMAIALCDVGLAGQFFRFAQFKGFEGAEAIDAHYDHSTRCFDILFFREDWPEITPGLAHEKIRADYVIAERKEELKVVGRETNG